MHTSERSSSLRFSFWVLGCFYFLSWVSLSPSAAVFPFPFACLILCLLLGWVFLRWCINKRYLSHDDCCKTSDLRGRVLLFCLYIIFCIFHADHLLLHLFYLGVVGFFSLLSVMWFYLWNLSITSLLFWYFWLLPHQQESHDLNRERMFVWTVIQYLIKILREQ